MSADTSIASNISDAKQQATTLQLASQSYLQQSVTASMGYATMGVIPDIDGPEIAIQPFNPNADLGAEYKIEYDNTLGALEGKMNDLLPTLINTWFPNFSVCFPKAEDWICNVLDNGGTGMKPAVEDAIWQRARDRENVEGARQEDEAINFFLARGFALPSGALSSRILSVQSGVADRVSSVNRDVMIKKAEIEIDTVKFAVEKAIQIRLQVWDAMMRYIGDYMRLGAIASDKAKFMVEAKRGLWDATSRYYDSLVRVEGLKMDADKFNKTMDYNAMLTDINSFNTRVTRQTQAALSSADFSAKLAAAWAGAQNSLSMIGNVTTIKG